MGKFRIIRSAPLDMKFPFWDSHHPKDDLLCHVRQELFLSTWTDLDLPPKNCTKIGFDFGAKREAERCRICKFAPCCKLGALPAELQARLKRSFAKGRKAAHLGAVAELRHGVLAPSNFGKRLL
jgi:hypothetical protein